MYYLPPVDVEKAVLEPAAGGSFCEWKGEASYFDVLVAGRVVRRAAWTYFTPSPDYAAIAGFYAFYPSLMDACYVDDEPVTPQPGDFYGGWITSDVVGPFKGEPGSFGW